MAVGQHAMEMVDGDGVESDAGCRHRGPKGLRRFSGNGQIDCTGAYVVRDLIREHVFDLHHDLWVPSSEAGDHRRQQQRGERHR